MYSQRDEESYIEQFFRGSKKGRFLDVGAYDGVVFSNTRRLVEHGWSGVLVEPSPSLHSVLEKRYGDNSKFQIVKKGIGLEAGVKPFYNFYGDAVGSFDIDHAHLWEEKGKRKYVELQIEVITWDTLLDGVGIDFDFVNLDAEGWSPSLLYACPFERLPKARMICVEYDQSYRKCLEFLEKKGFRFLHKTAENLLVVK